MNEIMSKCNKCKFVVFEENEEFRNIRNHYRTTHHQSFNKITIKAVANIEVVEA